MKVTSPVAAGSANPATPRGKAKQAREARAAALGELMATEPTQAAKLAFPASVLAELAATFPEAAAYLEQRGSWTGRLEYTIEDGVDMQSHRTSVVLKGATEDLDVTFGMGGPNGHKVTTHPLATSGNSELHVAVPDTVALGLADITVSRPDHSPLFGSGIVSIVTEWIVSEPARIESDGTYVFVALSEAKYISRGTGEFRTGWDGKPYEVMKLEGVRGELCSKPIPRAGASASVTRRLNRRPRRPRCASTRNAPVAQSGSFGGSLADKLRGALNRK